MLTRLLEAASLATLCALVAQATGAGASLLGPSLVKRKLDSEFAYLPSDFYRRCCHTSAVVGNHLYIDGGEVFYLNKTVPTPIFINSTYSIDLSASWTNKDVALNPIDKTSGYSLNYGNLFTDPSGESFYQWNGRLSQSVPATQQPSPPLANLWQFTIDGDSGTWSIVNQPNLKRLSHASSTQGNGTAYILGGYGDYRTDIEYYDSSTLRHQAGGLLTYEFSSQTWANHSIEGLAPTGWLFDSHFHYLKGLQREGLLLAMGGASAAPGNNRQGDETLNSFDYVTLYDATTQEWHNQSTTGDIPARRYDACSVGIAGDNGTFEIFLYGGSVVPGSTLEEEQSNNVALSELHVLSIPSFHWHKTPLNSTQSRSRHTCEVIGKRQMAVIGGLTAGLKFSLLKKDPWAQGFGIFDLTDLVLKSSYNASASAYQSPNIVKNYIAQNGQYPSSWDSNAVEGLFTNKAVDDNPDSSSGTNSSSSTPSPEPGSGGSGSNIGAIVGGVIGGIVVLVLLGLALFFFRRHRRPRGAQRFSETEPELQKTYKDGNYTPVMESTELESNRYESQKAYHDANPTPVSGTTELDSTHRVELPATRESRGYELSNRHEAP